MMSSNLVIDMWQRRKLFAPHWDGLSKRERDVIELRNGLCNGQNYTQREVAKFLGMVPSRLRRMEDQATKKLLASCPELPLKVLKNGKVRSGPRR